MPVKFLSATVLALGLMGLTPLAVAQQGGFSSPSLLPLTDHLGRPSPPPEEIYGYRRAPLQEKLEYVPPPAPLQSYSAPTLLPETGSDPSAWIDSDCGSCNVIECGCCPCIPVRCGIFGSTGSLLISKGGDDFNQLSFNDLDEAGAEITTQNSPMEPFLGGQLEVGYWINPCWGISATCWGAWGPAETTTVNVASLGGGNLNTVFDFGALSIGATGVNSLYDGAQQHVLTRSFDFSNLEFNLIQGSYYSNTGLIGVGFLMGPRWFRYREAFNYQSSDADAVQNAGLDDVNYLTAVSNNLFGLQAGARLNFQPCQRLRFFGAPKFGVYDNIINLDSTIGGPGGPAVVVPGNAFAGQAYVIHSSVHDFAFMGEIGVGADFFITRCWALTVGYRAVTATGIALPFEQIPEDFAKLNEAANINRNDSLLIHGAYAGVSYNY